MGQLGNRESGNAYSNAEKIENIVVMRSINSKNPGKKTKEVIIRNY